MTEEKFRAIQYIKNAQPGYDPALYDLGTRSAYLRGFEAARAVALGALQDDSRNDGPGNDQKKSEYFG